MLIRFSVFVQIKNLQDDKEACLASNKSLAEYNLSKQPVLAQQKATLAAKSTAARRLYDDFQQKSEKFSEYFVCCFGICPLFRQYFIS